MRVAGFSALCVVLAAGACAGDDLVETRFDSSAGLVTVALHGDGFVDVDGRRVPLEALVLDLRRSTREMAREELLRFVVRVRLGAAAGADALRKQQAARARLLGELEIMGVRQIVYL